MPIRIMILMSLIVCSPGLQAASVTSQYDACDSAVAAELGEGRVRSDVVTLRRVSGDMQHWMNVRFRPDGADETQRMRVQCRTDANGEVSALDISEGAWRKVRPNQAPKPID